MVSKSGVPRGVRDGISESTLIQHRPQIWLLECRNTVAMYKLIVKFLLEVSDEQLVAEDSVLRSLLSHTAGLTGLIRDVATFMYMQGTNPVTH